MTPLDAAHADMVAGPDDDAARLRFWGVLSEAALFLMLAEEAAGERIIPAEVEVDGVCYVLAFDGEERLAAFAEQVVPHAALSGRQLARLLAGRGVGIALNPDVAPSAMLIGAEAVDWLAALGAEVPDEVAAQITEVLPPGDVPAAVLLAIDRRLGLAGGMVRSGWLVGARGDDGLLRHVLVLVGVAPGAEGPLAAALAEALRFSGAEDAAIDVTFLAPDAPALSRIARVGLKIELTSPAPAPAAPPPASADRPPRLR